MMFQYRTLRKEDIESTINEIISCRNLDINDFIINSDVIYTSVYDFMFKVIDIKIVKNNDKLYTVNCVDAKRWIEPLLIQVSDTGALMDYFFADFIKICKIDLTDYFINYLDFSEIMDGVRVILKEVEEEELI